MSTHRPQYILCNAICVGTYLLMSESYPGEEDSQETTPSSRVGPTETPRKQMTKERETGDSIPN